MDVVTYQVVGLSPLLMNSPANMELDGGGLNVKKIRPPIEAAELAAYRLPTTGQLYFPATAFRSALLKGATGRRFGKYYATKVLAGSVFSLDTEVPLFDPDGSPLKDYEIDTRRVVIPKTGSVPRSRPRIERWAGHFSFEYDTDFVQMNWITDILTIAGKTIGVGDFRPEKKGSFGRFAVEPINQN